MVHIALDPADISFTRHLVFCKNIWWFPQRVSILSTQIRVCVQFHVSNVGKMSLMKIYVHSGGILSERSSNELCTFITEFVDNNVHLESSFHFVEVIDGYTLEFSYWLVSVLGVYSHCIAT